MGNSNAATTAADALRSFPNIEHIIMCGIAGGCPNPDAPDEHVRLGDIVFSNDAGIIEYDFVKETEKGSTVRSSPQKPSSRMLSVVGSLQADEIWDAALGRLDRCNHRRIGKVCSP
jgi:nucleoside phosphorylase